MMLKRNLLFWRFEEYWFDEAGFWSSRADIVALRTHDPVAGCPCFIPEQTLLLSLDPSPKSLVAGFDSRAKASIRQAAKMIQVELATSVSDRNLFYAAYKPFAKAKGLLIPDAAEEDELEIFLAKNRDGELVQAAAFLPAEKANIYRYRYGVYIRKSQANAALIQAAILHAKARGFKYFDLGGITLGAKPGSKDAGINFFKSQFGGKLTASKLYLRGTNWPSQVFLKFLGVSGIAARFHKLSALAGRLAKV